MKLNTLKATLYYACVILCLSLINSNVSDSSANSPVCENACQVCQRTVYQMKFQKMADCEFGGVCKNTCFKIQQDFNTNWSPFQPFMKDMFGKCEICFRAGYCTISECKEQELKEIEIINNVINSASITAKVDENLLKNLPEIKNVSKKDIPRARKLNGKLAGKLTKEITKSIRNKNTENLVSHIQSLVKSYFYEPFVPAVGGVHHILYAGKPLHSASDVTFWNVEASGTVTKTVDQTKALIKKLDEQIKNIKLAKKGAKAKEAEQIKKVAKKTKKEVKKMEIKYAKAAKKIAKQEAKLINAIQTHGKKDSKLADNLSTSLKKVQDVKQVVKQTQKDLRNEKKKLHY